MSSPSETTASPPAAPTAPPAKAEPKSRTPRRWLVVAAAVSILLVGTVSTWLLVGRGTRERPLTHQVRREKLQRVVTARGDLEAAERGEIVCRVRSRTP